MEKNEWAYPGTLRNTTVHAPRELSTDMHSQDPLSKVCFNPPHDDITKGEGLHFRQRKFMVNGVKGKFKVAYMYCVAFVYHTCSHLLEDRPIGETGRREVTTAVVREFAKS